MAKKLPKKLAEMLKIIEARESVTAFDIYYFGYGQNKAVTGKFLRQVKYPKKVLITSLEDMKKDFCDFVDEKIKALKEL